MTRRQRERDPRLAVNQALQTINNRVDEFGVAEPVIARQGIGSDRIVVQLPGVDDPERVKRLIKNTAFLEFRLVDYPAQRRRRRRPREEVARALRRRAAGEPRDPAQRRRATRRARSSAQRYYAVEKRQVITGRDLKNARARRSASSTSRWSTSR